MSSAVSRALALAALAVSIGGAIVFYGSRSTNAPTTDDMEMPAFDAEMAFDVSESGTSAEGKEASTSAPLAESAALEPQNPVREPLPPQASELALQGVELPQLLLDAESAFAAEPIEPSWASQTEAQILREISGLTARPMFSLQVECRSTMCRLQVVEPDKGPLDTRPTGNGGVPDGVAVLATSMRELVTRSGLESRGAMSVPNRSGSRVLVAYFAREARDAATGAR